MTAEDLGRRAGLVMGRDRPISASAVRNQENGTNGLPMSVARAYAEVLKVDAEWLLFGDRDLSPSEAERLAYEQEVNSDPGLGLNDLRITTYGIVSGRWIPEMVKPDHSESDNDIWVLIPGWSGNSRLCAYEVADNSLEPTFPKGAWLITAPHEDAIMSDGTIVLASKMRPDDIYQSIRMLRAVPGGVDLIGVGAVPMQREKLLRDRTLEHGMSVAEAVICCLHYLPGGRGPSLDAGTPFASPSLDPTKPTPTGGYHTIDHPKRR